MQAMPEQTLLSTAAVSENPEKRIRLRHRHCAIIEWTKFYHLLISTTVIRGVIRLLKNILG